MQALSIRGETMITIDAQRIEIIMTIIVLSSLASAVMVFFAIWFLSRWVEVKELTLKLLKRIDENYVEQKSEKLKAIYVKQNFNEEATLNYEEPQTTTVETSQEEQINTPTELQLPVFEEDVPTTTKAPPTTKDIKELIKKRKSTNIDFKSPE